MSKILCVSVRLESLVQISPKAYKARDFQGNEAFIPVSQVFGQDYEVQKSSAYWIAEWCLDKKGIVYSWKKKAWFDRDSGRRLPDIKIEKHTPHKLTPKENNEITELRAD